jgi:hypothetical protein
MKKKRTANAFCPDPDPAKLLGSMHILIYNTAWNHTTQGHNLL